MRDFCTGPKVVVPVVRVVPVDVDLAVVGVPVHVRHVAVRVARTRVLLVSVQFTNNLFQNCLGYLAVASCV